MKRDEIGGGEKVIKFNLFDTDSPRCFRCQERIIGDNLHLQPLRPVGHNRPDIAAADKAKRLAGDLGPHEAGFFPFASLR